MTLPETPISPRELTPFVEQGLYRIAHEALDNVVRHAGATRLSLALTRSEDGLTMVISDDGAGFEPGDSVPEGRFGLQGIRERAELLGAHLTIDSKSGMGTTVTVTVPSDVLPAWPPGKSERMLPT